MSKFEDFVEAGDLDPAERAQLERVHELLLAAGPPPELGATLAKLPADVTRARVLPFPARRRAGAALLLAAALAAAAFGGGYVVANHNGGFSTVRVAAMTGKNALGSLSVGSPDAGGNWPIKFKATGLPPLAGKRAYYELFVVDKGKPVFPCGGFKVRGAQSVAVTFTVPYKVEPGTKWVVTAIGPGEKWPGRIVMT